MTAELAALALWLAAAAAAGAPPDARVAPDAPPPEPAAAGSTARALAMTVEPAALVLGKDGRARVTIVSDEAPRLQTSAGRVSRLAEAGPGTYTAELAAPILTHPQIALVLATTSSGAAFVPVPLLGKGVAVARTAPGASVAVRVGDRTFGPVVAGADGVARVPVEVPPGERVAHHGPRALELSLPPVRRVAMSVTVAGDPLRADRDAALTVVAAAATPDGKPWASAPVTLVASAGTLDAPAELAPGLFRARWRLPAGAPGKVSIEVRAGDAGAERVELDRPAGPPARVELALSRDRATAGDGPLEVTAAAVDAAGNAVDPAPRLAASGGTLAAPARAGPGKVRATWTPPRRLEGAAEVVLTATAGAATARRAVSLAPGAPTTLAVAVAPDALRADGTARADVQVALADAFGNPLPDPAVVEARHGAIAPAVAAPGGLRVARYTAPWDWRSRDETVVARAGALVSDARLRVAPAPQQLAVVARAGVQRGLGPSAAPYAAGGLEVFPLRLGGGLGAGADLAWTSPRSRTGAFAVGAGVRSVVAAATYWPMSVTALARARLAPRLVGFAGAGGGAVAVHGTVSLDGRRTSDEWGVAPLAHLSAALGLDVPRLRARARLEVRGGWQGDPSMASFHGSARTFTVALGVTHDAL